MSDRYKNLQVKQPNLAPLPDNNGWPEPLTDPSSPLRIEVTEGRNGESMQGKIQTSQQAAGEHHKAEGDGEPGILQPPVFNQKAPSAMKTSGLVSDPGGADAKATMPPYSEDAIGRGNAYPTKTTQQVDGAFSRPEGE